MNGYDTRVAAALARLVPEPVAVDGWDVVVAAVRPPRRHRRRVAVALSLLAVVLVVPLIAYATGGSWWFQRGGRAPELAKPIAGVPSVVAAGTFDGERWTTVAYVSKPPADLHLPNGRPATRRELVCLTLIVGDIGDMPNSTGCGLLRGLPPGPPYGTWMTTLNGGDPAIVSGAVARGVARVELVLNEKRRGKPVTSLVQLRTVEAVGSGVRVFAFPYPQAGIVSIVALDGRGKVLQRI